MASKKAGLLTAEEILAAEDVLYEDVSVPEWGGVVRVRGLTGTQRDAFEAESVQVSGKNVERNMLNIRARLVLISCVDESGKKLFNHLHVEKLGQKSAKALDRVFSVAMRLSGLSDGDVEELAGNFADGQSDGSISD